MATAKQINANRNNAQKSTGPKTEQGKAVAARNSLRHGLLSKILLLEDESEDQFKAVYQGLEETLQPVGELEETLVDRIAASAWRLRRLLRIESGLMSQNVASPINLGFDVGQDEILSLFNDNGPIFDRLSRYESGIERSFYRALHELQRIQAARSGRSYLTPVAVDITHESGNEIGFVSQGSV